MKTSSTHEGVISMENCLHAKNEIACGGHDGTMCPNMRKKTVLAALVSEVALNVGRLAATEGKMETAEVALVVQVASAAQVAQEEQAPIVLPNPASLHSVRVTDFQAKTHQALRVVA